MSQLDVGRMFDAILLDGDWKPRACSLHPSIPELAKDHISYFSGRIMPQSPHLGNMARKQQKLEGFSMREAKEPAIGYCFFGMAASSRALQQGSDGAM